MHCRQQIRDAVVTELEGLAAGYTVYNHRFTEVPRVKLPALTVYTTEERIERSNMDGVLVRSLTLVVDAVHESMDSTTPNKLDDAAVDVETAVLTALGALVLEEFNLADTTLDIQSDAQGQVGALSIEFLIRYRTSEDDPETLVD